MGGQAFSDNSATSVTISPAQITAITNTGTGVILQANTDITLDKDKPNSVFDADGSAVVIHAKGDDYKSDPAGDAGGRIACGVIK